jgi:hypothetical protein
MKTIILKVIFIALVTLGLNGCYTIIWSPDSALPTEDNSVTNIYYGDSYYGDYYYFYDSPWWWDYSYNPPASAVTRPTRDESTQPIRDLGDRGTPPRTIDTQPPSRDANPPSTGSSGSTTGNNGSTTETTVRSSSSSSSNSSGRESSSSGSVRNNNGGRSSGGRK